MTESKSATAEITESPLAGSGADTESKSNRSDFMRRLGALLRYRLDLVIAILALSFFLFIALFPQLATPFDPLKADPAAAMLAPSLEHPFGTDSIGRDVFARVVYGAGISLRAAALAVLISLLLGSVLGVLAGAVGSWLDSAISRLFDALLAIPHLLLIFAFLAVFGNGVIVIAIGIGVAGCVSFGRVMRAQVMRVRTSTYVEAAVASGVKPFGVVTRHIVPNAMAPIIALAALDFGTAMLTIGAMGYLGFGQAPPAPEWGAMIAQGQAFLQTAPWLSVLPGLMFVVVVLAVNRISRAIGSRND